MATLLTNIPELVGGIGGVLSIRWDLNWRRSSQAIQLTRSSQNSKKRERQIASAQSFLLLVCWARWRHPSSGHSSAVYPSRLQWKRKPSSWQCDVTSVGDRSAQGNEPATMVGDAIEELLRHRHQFSRWATHSAGTVPFDNALFLSSFLFLCLFFLFGFSYSLSPFSRVLFWVNFQRLLSENTRIIPFVRFVNRCRISRLIKASFP